ncbi:MAG: host-nuclease inhibitor Gam family protein [bacterium]
MPRIKSAAPALTRDQVDDLVGQITEADNKRAALVAVMNSELDAARAEFSKEIGPLTELLDDKTAALESWARANVDQFGNARSLEFSRGTIGFRLGQPTVKPTKGSTLRTVLDYLKRVPWGQVYVRFKEELDKEALIAARADLTADQISKAGFTFAQDDRFYVEPKQDQPAEVVK